MQDSSNPISFPARIYQRNSENPISVTITVDTELGYLSIVRENGKHQASIPLDKLDLKLGGSTQDRIVLFCGTTGDTIISSDIKLLDTLQQSKDFPTLAQQIDKAKIDQRSSHMQKFMGVALSALPVFLFIIWISVGFTHYKNPWSKEPSKKELIQENKAEAKTSPVPVSTIIAEEKKELEKLQPQIPEPKPIAPKKVELEQSEEMYLQNVQKLLKKNWHPPILKNNKQTIVEFAIDKDGKTFDTKISKSSGSKTMDQAALKAISTIPLTAPPKGIETPLLIEFTFKCNVKEKRS
jgi:TonB family protein